MKYSRKDAKAYARQHLSRLDYPEPVIGTHENLVVGMAHGYTMVTGKPQAVMVHVSVGAANAVCGSRNQVPAPTSTASTSDAASA